MCIERDRLQKILRHMAGAGLGQMVITHPASVFYLTGMRCDPGKRLLALLVSKENEPVLLINKLFWAPEDADLQVIRYDDTEDAAAMLAGYIDPTGPLGVDQSMAAGILLRLMELGSVSGYVNASHCVDRIRARKDAEEIRRMRHASRINDAVMEEVRRQIAPGVTEEALADVVRQSCRRLGAEGVSFEPMIGFGPSAAIGHHEADKTALREGDCVLVDIGCRADGYCSDMTRTYFCGEPSARMWEIHRLVRRANDAARGLIRPGVPLSEIDAAARSIIESAGYGRFFTHRLGHFIGIEMHEAGDVSAASEECAEPGMIFSVEPGVYLPGEGGVRIEDLVLVTGDGCETLNHSSREP